MRTFLLVLVAASLAVPAGADTVWLANGRVLQVEDARIENGRVVFRAYGVEVAMPADLVRQIRRDDGRSPGSVPRTINARPADGDPGRRPATRVRERRPPIAPPAPEPESFYLDPAGRAYWEEKMAWLREQISSLEAGQERRRDGPRAGGDYRSARRTANRRELQAWRALESALRAEARRLGVPSDWLRLDRRLGD